MSETIRGNMSESDNRLMNVAALVEASDAAIIGKSLDNIILSWNRGAERLYGYPAEEAVGKSIRLLIPPDRLNEPDEIVHRITQGDFVEPFETVRRAKDGRVLDISLQVIPTEIRRER